jgi:hypothetical protein
MKKLSLIITLSIVLSSGVFAQQAGNTGEATFLDPTNYTRQATRFERGGVIFVNSDVYYQLKAFDKETGLDKIEYAINGGSFQNYINPFNLVEEGYHIIRYRGIDNGDNVEVTKVLQVYVDNTAPNSSVETDRALYRANGVTYASNRTRFYISAFDNESGSGVKSTYAGTQVSSLQGRGDGTRNPNNFFSLTDEGPTSLYYTAMDNVGNLARVRQFNVTIDATPPTVKIQASENLRLREGVYVIIPSEELKTEDGKIIITSKNRVAFSAEDDLSGVRALYVKVNEEEFVQYFEPIEVKGGLDYVIQVKAEDNVGNISAPVTFNFSVDSVAPESTIELINREGTVLDQQ